jgi:hypothetical protein
MKSLNEIKTILLDVEEKRRSLWNLYSRDAGKKYVLKPDHHPDHVGLSSNDDASREFFKIMFIFQQLGVSVSYNKKLHTTMLGYKGKVVILQKDKNRYHVVRGNKYLDITSLVQGLYNDIKDRASTIHAAREFPALAERLYGLRTIFFDPWSPARG